MPTISTFLIPLLLTSYFLPSLVSAQDTQYGACVTSCFSTDPISSTCTGDETGQALDQCTCNSFSPSGDPLITCIQQCPEDQQLQYAQGLPDLCNQVLFPNLDLSSAPSPTAENTAANASGPSETAAATQTGSAASATASPDGAAAFGAGALGYLAYAAMAALL